MPPRHDVSGVPLQGGYIAKQCPVRIQWDVIRPVAPAPEPETVRLRMQDGIDFERSVVGTLTPDPDGTWVVVPEGLRAEEATRVTVEAMAREAEVILGGWLPLDAVGRRVGKPDLLVFVGDGYLPVDIKHHLTLDDGEDTVLVSDFDAPRPDAGRHLDGMTLRKRRDDALQLAHYRRMLEACRSASVSPMAGILGKEGVIVWYDLDEPMWLTPAKSDGKKRKLRTSMEVYDFEFGFRLDIAAVAQQHLADPTVEPLVVPLSNDECGECPWREHCRPIYRAGSGDPTLLPRVGYPQWRLLRDAGVTDRAGVAGLDHLTARLAAENDKVPSLIELAAAADPATPVGALIPRAKKQQERLADAGFATAADVVARLDPLTASIAGSFLADAIVRARAALGDQPIYRTPGGETRIPRFDIEIDLDMENAIDGEVYLWGALITDRSGSGLAPVGYHPFVTWVATGEGGEEQVFSEFWEWLTELARRAATAGVTLGVYTWSGAEARELGRISHDRAERHDEVEAFVSGGHWVDLLTAFDAGWTNGESSSLKVVATAVGYRWAVEDPGGAVSMVRHAEAVTGDQAARDWLLEYNRGDVEATLAVREWMTGPGQAVPEVPTGPWPG